MEIAPEASPCCTAWWHHSQCQSAKQNGNLASWNSSTIGHFDRACASGDLAHYRTPPHNTGRQACARAAIRVNNAPIPGRRVPAARIFRRRAVLAASSSRRQADSSAPVANPVNLKKSVRPGRAPSPRSAAPILRSRRSGVTIIMPKDLRRTHPRSSICGRQLLTHREDRSSTMPIPRPRPAGRAADRAGRSRISSSLPRAAR